jgi:hypothetical protein
MQLTPISRNILFCSPALRYPEWIADYMLSSALFPLPFSLSNMLSYLFPETTQNYYDAVLEDFVTRQFLSPHTRASPFTLYTLYIKPDATHARRGRVVD